MLTLIRKELDSISVGLAEGVRGNMTVSELFCDGPITIRILHVHNKSGKVRIGIDAPTDLLILRGEMENPPQECPYKSY